MSYNYLTQFNSPNSTPGSQTAGVWGVNRELRNIAIHWWGDPSTNPTFEGVVAHLDDPNSGVSAHYVATGDGRRVACLVSPDDNSWSTMSDNPYCISIECDPRCRDEDYDVVAELVADIRSAYGNLPLVPHRQFVATDCPGDWNLGRIDELAAGKVSHDPWGAVTDLNPPVVPPVVTPPVIIPPVAPPVTPPVTVPTVPIVINPITTGTYQVGVKPPISPVVVSRTALGTIIDRLLFFIGTFIKQVLGVE